MKTNLLILISFFINLSVAQNYNTVDSIVSKYPDSFKSIEDFSNKISDDFSNDIEKTRAVYHWVSNHIKYDYLSFNNRHIKVNRTFYSNENELATKQKEYAGETLIKKTGVCEGYAQLVKFVLEELNIESKVISGYAKNTIREIGVVSNNANHSWNAVFLNDKWHLIDATWSTGNEELKPNYFNFDDSYFLTKPEDLIWSHYPDKREWQLIQKPVSRATFFYAPIIHSGYYNSGLILSKMRGILRTNNTLTIEFESISEAKKYEYMFVKNSNYSEEINFKKKNNKYIATIPFRKGKKDELIIFDGDKACISFKVL